MLTRLSFLRRTAVVLLAGWLEVRAPVVGFGEPVVREELSAVEYDSALQMAGRYGREQRGGREWFEGWGRES